MAVSRKQVRQLGSWLKRIVAGRIPVRPRILEWTRKRRIFNALLLQLPTQCMAAAASPQPNGGPGTGSGGVALHSGGCNGDRRNGSVIVMVVVVEMVVVVVVVVVGWSS